MFNLFRILLTLQIIFITTIYSEDTSGIKTELLESQKEEFVETNHQVKIDGQLLQYKATTGNLILRDENNKPTASIFFISYNKEGVEDNTLRPITFCFNGGPGSSSVWLHLGTFGPKRVKLTETGDALPPYTLVDNEYSILDQTDLVFIDPISTGFSRAIPADNAKKFHGVEEDIKSIAEFLRLYLTRYERWDSPKFIAGESYGTTRAVGLAGYLHKEQFIYVNGIILISSVLNFQSIKNDSGNDLPYLVFLPTFTATSWYHKKLPPDLQANLSLAIKESKEFVKNEYVNALFKGNLLSSTEKENIANKLARFTGISADYIQKSDLRISQDHYFKELLRSDNRIIGYFDGRFTGLDQNVVGEYAEYDPSADAIFGAFTSTFNQYIRSDLNWKTDLDYKILAKISNKWDYGPAKNQYLNVGDILSTVMIRNPHMRVFVANGLYDLATPFFATEYTFNHLGLDKKEMDRVTMEYYDAGHMMYIYHPALIKLKVDLAKYYQRTLKEQEEEN